MQDKTINVTKLQAGVRKNPKFQQALRILAERRRGRQDTTFRRVKRLLDLGGAKDWSAKELKQLFELLQDSGAGRIVFGAKTPRFVWDFHLQSVARAALGMPEIQRHRKDGSEISEDGFRRPTPARLELPKVALPESILTSAEPTSAVVPTYPLSSVSPLVGDTGVTKQVVTVTRNGFEFEVDLAKMTPESCQKFAQMLLSL